MGFFKRSGNERCSLCNTETATGFEIPLVQHKADTNQSPAIVGLRANIGRYHLWYQGRRVGAKIPDKIDQQ